MDFFGCTFFFFGFGSFKSLSVIFVGHRLLSNCTLKGGHGEADLGNRSLSGRGEAQADAPSRWTAGLKHVLSLLNAHH